jgi:hypothetical protein
MSKGHVAAAAVIPARPEDVYAILADYRYGHPQILPKLYFTKVEVEQGGTGAGTIIRVFMRVLGCERIFRQVISEPEPGRVLVERDLDADLTTTFTVTPIDARQQAYVRIATEWEARPGIAGWIEKVMTRRLLRSIYAKELRQLATYVQRTESAAISV